MTILPIDSEQNRNSVSRYKLSILLITMSMVLAFVTAGCMTIPSQSKTVPVDVVKSSKSVQLFQDMLRVDKNGLIAYIVEHGSGLDKVSTLYVIRPDGSDSKIITQVQGLLLSPTWSFDGQSLAYSVQLLRRNPKIFIHHLQDNTILKAVDREEPNLSPSFSPDGTQLLFSSSEAGNFDIYLKNLATDATQRIITLPSTEIQPSYAADGKSFVYTSDKGRTNTPRIYRYYFDTEKTTLIKTEGHATSPQLSLDGSKLAYLNGRYAAIMNLKTGQVTNLADTRLDEPARLSPSGLYAVYPSKNNQGKGGLVIRSLYNESSYTISSPTDGIIRSPIWSR